MKKYNLHKLVVFFCLALFALNSCNYLDIVPDEREKEEDAFKDVEAMRRYLYSCYSYIPNLISGSESLDFFTGDELITGFEHETFANFPKGNFTATAPVISYWNTLFAGIRQCYMLQENIDQVPNVDAATVADYKAQTDFLIGYFHFLLMRCYGPVILVKSLPDINTAPKDYLARSTMEETIEFITGKFAESAKVLPAYREIGSEVGLATSMAAKALRAYTYMYYASPLWNGGRVGKRLASQLVNLDGTALVSAEEDRNRWVIARDAYMEAIEAARAVGHELYREESPKIQNTYPENDRLRILKANLLTIVKYNKEEIWTMNIDEGAYGMQRKSLPFQANVAYNGLGPTLHMLNRFYTKNGLPYDVDPETKGLDRFAVVDLTQENVKMTFADGSEAVVAEAGKQTSQINLNREPRYYAWIAFQNGFYEITNAATNGAYSADASVKKYKNKQMVTGFMKNENCGRQNRDRGYPPSGFLNKKGVHPDNAVSKNGLNPFKKYPWPVIRLAELYLGYAECCAEVGTAADMQKAIEYVDMIRERAGIPGVVEAWSKVGGVRDAVHLRDIVRQERQVEMYLEHQNFWDMRRWELADRYFSVRHSGMDMTATSMDAFSKETEIPFVRSFGDQHWLLPIPAADVYNNPNLIQNPGY